MLNKIKKYLVAFLVIIIMVMGCVIYYKDTSHRKKVTKLYNEIAMQAETIEVQDGVFQKQVLTISDTKDLLGRLADEHGGSISLLQKELDKKDEKILSLTKTTVHWRKNYEALVKASQTDVPTDPDDPDSPTRTKVEFEKDFGYIGVNGYTLTDPAEAFISVKQNRPLMLVLTLSQDRKKRWTSSVASSEDNIEVDVDISAVNPYMFDTKWYEKVSLDAGIQYAGALAPYVGSLYSLDNGVYFGAGVQVTGNQVSYYGSLGYSWAPFRR